MENGDMLVREEIIDRSAAALKPTFDEEQLDQITRAIKYAYDIQEIYLAFIQKAETKKEAPAPFPYPAYSLPPNYVPPSSAPTVVVPSMTLSTPSSSTELLTMESTKAASSSSTAVTTSPSSAASAPLTNVLQLHNLSILSRIYIGSINFELSDADLKAAFSVFGPVKSISMSMDPITQHHKGYCFLEFETPEAAALALETMNGAELGGRTIKVGRSNNFPPDLPPGIPRPLGRRIYVANIHECVTENDIIDIFSSFGIIKACSLVPDTAARRHKGYGYVEFEDESAAQTSMLALRGFNLGGLELKTGRTIVGGEMPYGMSILDKLPSYQGKKSLPDAVLNAAKAINQTIAISSGSLMEQDLSANMSFATATSTLVPQSSSKVKSGPSVMLLTNMITAEELDDDIQSEVMEECKKYGPLIKVDPILSSSPESVSLGLTPLSPSTSFVHFYVVFEDAESAQKATQVFNGRWFGGRRITAKLNDYVDYLKLSNMQ